MKERKSKNKTNDKEKKKNKIQKKKIDKKQETKEGKKTFYISSIFINHINLTYRFIS